MRLEPLYRARFAYEEHATARLQGGLEHHFWIAEGRAEGSITGRIRGANHPQRRPDGVFCPEFQGVIETDDGATIFFDWQGYGRSYSEGRQQIVAAATHLADDHRYRRLNDVVCAIEGEVRPRSDGTGADLVIDVYELAEEFQP